MDSKLELRFNQLENSRLQLLAELEKRDDKELNFHPGKDKWSVIQVMHHLIIIEQLSIGYINKKLTYKTNINKSGFGSAIRVFVLTLILKMPFRFKAPKIVSEVPDNSDLNETKNQWDQVRKEMQELFDNLPEDFLNKNIFKHALAGKMNIYQMLSFMEEHFKHHVKQIDRIARRFDTRNEKQ